MARYSSSMESTGFITDADIDTVEQRHFLGASHDGGAGADVEC